MKNRPRTFGLVALVVVLAAALVWYRFAPGEAPAGQPPLVALDTTSLDSLRADFNRDVNQVRLILLLSPTWGTCLRGASAVEEVLKRHGDAGVRIFAVWQPMLPTDWAAPASSVLRRLSDRRAQQYWDPNHLLAKRMRQDARVPQPEQECCVRSERRVLDRADAAGDAVQRTRR